MNIASFKKVVSDQEWQLRVDLAACYRLVRGRRASTFAWLETALRYSFRPSCVALEKKVLSTSITIPVPLKKF